MLSLAVKTCVIAFLGALTSTIMLSYVQAFDAGSKESSITGDMPLLIQCLLMALLMYVLTKQIPQMVQGLLNGTPNITGASMTSIAKQGLSGASSAAGAVASGGATLASGIAGAVKTGAKKDFADAGGGLKGIGVAGILAPLHALDKTGGMVASAMGKGALGLLKNNPIGKGWIDGVNKGRNAFVNKQGSVSDKASDAFDKIKKFVP